METEHCDIAFILCDALDLPFENEFDVVFSNAVFHWIYDHDVLLKNIRKALKAGGVLVCEFGAVGNIETINRAFSEQALLYGYPCNSRFNFSTAEVFSDMPERNQFVIDSICDYDRPTPLNDGEKGLEHFLRQFYAVDMESVPEAIQEKIIKGTEDRIRDDLWHGSRWIADYRRPRAIAHI